MERPGQSFLGTGKSGKGPTAAAIANAIANATGAPIRELPLTPRRVHVAIGIWVGPSVCGAALTLPAPSQTDQGDHHIGAERHAEAAVTP